MVSKDRKKPTGSPKVQVGEIDTSAPFQSVKDAVNLFGEGAFSGEKPAIRKPRPQSAERVLAKETRLHLAQKELNKLKEQLKNAETTRAQALTELERAKRTVDDLTKKLKIVCESKDLAVKATEAAKSQVNQLEAPNDGSVMGEDGSWKVDLETVETKKQNTQENIMETHKLQKAMTSVSKKKVLMPSISGIFHKKKNQVEGNSPSYLPGEKTVW